MLLQRDARVRVACLREVEDGALRQQLLYVRVARAEKARLEVSDTRLRDEGRRGGDLGGGGGGCVWVGGGGGWGGNRGGSALGLGLGLKGFFLT